MLFVPLAVALIGVGGAQAGPTDWWGNTYNGNYLKVREHFFTHYIRLTGEWTVFSPAYCTGDYDEPIECGEEPGLSVHIYFRGREVYSDELFTFGTRSAGGSYMKGTFTERIYWWMLPNFSCLHKTGIGLYSWRIQMDDPFGRPHHQNNVRHANAIRTYCN